MQRRIDNMCNFKLYAYEKEKSKKRREKFHYFKTFDYLCTMRRKIIQKKMITDISAELDKKYGAPGTPEREIFDEEAYAFYTGQLLHDARKEAKVTQAELAKRINSTKSYISRVENGDIIPSVVKFWEMITSLGMRVEIVKPI